MLEGVPDEGAQINRAIGHTKGKTSDVVGHVEPQRDKVEAVDSLPVIEATVDFPGIPEIKNGVEPELIIKAKRLGLNL